MSEGGREHPPGTLRCEINGLCDACAGDSGTFYCNGSGNINNNSANRHNDNNRSSNSNISTNDDGGHAIQG